MTRLRLFLSAFGDPGHAFPMLALGARLVERGHEVVLETWERWRAHVEAHGMRFAAAPEYPVFPTRERPLKPYEAVVLATAHTRPAIAELAPDAVVQDILTLAPAMAAELEGIPVATLVPHLYPPGAPGFPPYSMGARLPATRFGARLWQGLSPLVEAGLRRGRRELNETRRQLGLAPVARLHGGISDRLCIVATFPQLEYPRPWPPGVHVVGPVLWEPPSGDFDPPPGTEPLVLVAPSTSQDPEQRLVRAALEGLAHEQVRLLAIHDRRAPSVPVAVPANARMVEWLSYSRMMPRCALVICHAGYGTLARALIAGTPVVCVPNAGDMAENAARADWAGVGVRLPWRLLSPLTLRLTVRRALGDPALRQRAQELAAWSRANDGVDRAAELVESLGVSRRGGSARTR